METKISKSQQEIWDAKEALYEQIKDLTLENKIEFLHLKARSIIDKYYKGKIVHLEIN